MNRLLFDVLEGKEVERPPVWIMRQAGRYMPSYQKLRAKHSLNTLFKNADLIDQVTMIPIEELDVDAAIVFSDILLPFEMHGIEVNFALTGPKLDLKGRDPFEWTKAFLAPPREPFFLTNAIRQLQAKLDRPLIGFCGGPLTTLAYLFERPSQYNLKKTKQAFYQNSRQMKELLEAVTAMLIAWADFQIESGIKVFQVFETWLGCVSAPLFQIIYPCLEKLVKHIEKKASVILFGLGLHPFLKEICQLPINALSVDSSHSLAVWREKLPHEMVVQGNFDPTLLLSSPKNIEEFVKEELRQVSLKKGFILNLSHGVTPEIPQENVEFFVDLLKNTQSKALINA